MIQALWFTGIKKNELAEFLCGVDGVYDLVRLEQSLSILFRLRPVFNEISFVALLFIYDFNIELGMNVFNIPLEGSPGNRKIFRLYSGLSLQELSDLIVSGRTFLQSF